MGYPDFYKSRAIFKETVYLDYTDAASVAGSYDIFDYDGSGETLYSFFQLYVPGGSFSIGDKIDLYIDTILVATQEIAYIPLNHIITDISYIHPIYYNNDWAARLSFAKGIVFRSNFKLVFTQVNLTTMSVYADITMGVY